MDSLASAVEVASHAIMTPAQRPWSAEVVASRAIMTLSQRMLSQRNWQSDALPNNDGKSIAFDTDDALARLEAEVEAREATWRIAARLVLAAPWDQRWQAGNWVSHRTGEKAKAVSTRRKMTAVQRSRVDALPYGKLVPFSIDEALARLEVEVDTREASWRIPQKLVLAAPWDPSWKAGRWVNSRIGQGAQAVALCANMTSAQRRRFEALPYGWATRAA